MNDRFGHELLIGDDVAFAMLDQHGRDTMGRGTIKAFVRNDIIIDMLPINGVSQTVNKRGNSIAKNLLPAPPNQFREAFDEAFAHYLLLLQLAKEKING